MAKQSAGILLYRQRQTNIEVLIVHPGGPFWAKKDRNAWSIPKGEFTDMEEGLVAARREFAEELSVPAPAGEALDLGYIKQSSGKTVYAWAVEGDMDVADIKSNTVEIEWPKGNKQVVPEVDRAEWVSLAKARQKLIKSQVEFVDRLADRLGVSAPKQPEAEQTSLF